MRVLSARAVVLRQSAGRASGALPSPSALFLGAAINRDPPWKNRAGRLITARGGSGPFVWTRALDSSALGFGRGFLSGSGVLSWRVRARCWLPQRFE